MLIEAENIVKQFLPILEGILNAKDINVAVEENKEKSIPETGVGGFCPDSHTVHIFIDSKLSSLTQNLEKEIKSTLAHEFHHAVRNGSINWETDTLLGAMVTEGLADHFDLQVNKGEIKPWSKTLDEIKLKELMDKAEREFSSRSYNYNDWFFGNEEAGIPKWAGYSLGFKIVEDYLNKTGKKASDLAVVPPELFI